MKRILLTAKQQSKIIKQLQDLLASFPKLTMETKTCGLFCYYRYTGKHKKLLFYLNPRETEIVFGISHRNTDILEMFPILKIIADETRTSVLKIKITKIEDIESKAIRSIIEMIIKHLSEKQRSQHSKKNT